MKRLQLILSLTVVFMWVLGPLLRRVAAAEPAGYLLLESAGPERQAPRGWPMPIRWLSATETVMNDVLVVVSGSGEELRVPPVSPGRWWLSADQTRALSVGPAVVRVGGVETALNVVDLTNPLSAEEQDEKRLLDLRFALAMEQPETARQLAQAWIAQDPEAPAPRELLGDALVALSRLPEALVAYNEAINRTVWIEGPERLLERARSVRARLIAALPRRPVPSDPVDPPDVGSLDTLEKQDAFFAVDTAGQWASSATASSAYRTTDYAAARATGAPDVTRYGDSPRAWASLLADAGDEWLEVHFPKAVHAIAVRVRQVFNPGAIIRVEVADAIGPFQPVFAGIDASVYRAGEIAWFIATFPRTAQPVDRVRLTLDSKRVAGWNEIDAVQLVEGLSAPPLPPKIVQAIVASGEARFLITWTSRLGARYRIERSSMATGGWTAVVSAYPERGAEGLTTTYSEAFSEGTSYFYRVVAVP